jgi:hypothetical protein
VARAPDIAANLSCAVGRQRGAYSVVVHLGGLPPSAQTKSSFALMKRTRSSVLPGLAIRTFDPDVHAIPIDHRDGQNGQRLPKERALHVQIPAVSRESSSVRRTRLSSHLGNRLCPTEIVGNNIGMRAAAKTPHVKTTN